MSKRKINHKDLVQGQKYKVNDRIYRYDGYSTLWNLRMIDENGALTVFTVKTTDVLVAP